MSSWTKEKTLLLIEKIRVSNVWDIKSKEYKDTNKRKGIYSAIGEVLNFTASEIESKWHTVKSQFSRELSKVLASHKSGLGVEDVYCPSWYAYGSLKFLRDTHRPHIIRTISEESQEESYPTSFGTMSQEQLSLCWDNFHINMSSGINSLLVSEDLVDVTLAVDGQYLKAHKIILSVCSPYFKTLFSVNPCKHPIVFMKDISYPVMNDLLTFMYQGEVQVNQENLDTFIKAAEALEIKGLAGDNKNTEDVIEGVISKKPTQQLKTKNIRKQFAPTPMKKTKLSLSNVETEPIVTAPIDPKILIKPEFVSTTNITNNCPDLRTQACNSIMKNHTDDFDGNQIEGDLNRTANYNIQKEKEDREIILPPSIDPTVEIKPEFVSSTDINNCINIKMEPCDDSLEGEITANSFKGGAVTDFIEEALDGSFMEVMEQTQAGTSNSQVKPTLIISAMGDYEKEQTRLEKMMREIITENNNIEDNIIYDDNYSNSDEEDIVEAREDESDTEQEFDDDADKEISDNNATTTYFIGKDKQTKWNKMPPLKSIPIRAENIVVRLPNSKLPTRSLQEPFEIWKYFINEKMLELIVESTNIYISLIAENYSRDRDTMPTNKEEVQALLGLLYYAGILKANHLNTKELWMTDGSGVEIFRLTMSMTRFRFLLHSIRFDDKRTRKERIKLDNLASIRNYFDHFVNNCKTGYTHSKFVTIDEKLEFFRGRCGFRQYIPSKPNKYGIKIFALCDARMFYTSNLEVYVGQQPEGPYHKSNSPQAIVERLCEPIYNSGRNLTINNRFTSIALLNKLLEKQITIVGTIRKNKKELPVEFVNSGRRLQKSSMFGFTEKCALVSYIPKKNKNVLLVSSMHKEDNIDPTSGENRIPDIVTFYNSTKGGVDTVDQLCSHYNCARNSQRWPMVVFYASLNIAGINALVLYKLNNDNANLLRREFLQRLAVDLIRPHLLARFAVQSTPRNIKLRIQDICNIPQAQPVATNSRQTGRCHYCDAKKNRKTRYFCKSCNKFMCLEHVTVVCDSCYGAKWQ